ncbi:MAG: hypothetical protein K5871_06505 [Lachnospiraceae bacterium]|nr:hypothetical protein [Lachnospiraceae bacterium]
MNKVKFVFGKVTIISFIHYLRLIYRSAIFVTLLVFYIINKIQGKGTIIELIESNPAIIMIVWLVFALEMGFRFFPSKLESPGCQKQFAGNYQKSGKTEVKIQDNNASILVLLIWISFNMVFGALHMAGILDDGIMLLLCSLYSVCDVICILFFCPFQSWFMKNKCCSTCRIYNWDYAMMFTPLFFVQKSYLWTLLAMSFGLLIRWEITFYRHPERFSENTNDYLKCKNCTEKLCAHKNQLQRLWTQIEEYTVKKIDQLKK